MLLPKFTRLELQVMDALWKKGRLSIREIQESFPKRARPVYTTIQTTVYRLEERGAIRRAKKISNAHIFEAVVSRETAGRRLLDEILSVFEGKAEPVMAHLVESGKLTADDVRSVEKLIEELDQKKPEK